jgi:DNA sulfur modification protein DndE
MPFTLTDVLQANFRTSRTADTINDELRRVLGLPTRYGPARLAIARSLCSAEPLTLAQAYNDDPGKVIKSDQLFGSDADLATWTVLIAERASRSDISRRDLQVLVAAHWQRGIELLWQEWQDCEQDFNRFVRALCDRAGLVAHRGDSVDASYSGKQLSDNFEGQAGAHPARQSGDRGRNRSGGDVGN